MRKSVVGMAIALLGFGISAYAGHCPMDMRAIDAALSSGETKLSAEQLAEVKKLREEGEAAHKAGNHGESMEKLAEAKKILGI
ncbi:MAG TPA: hypothetical protein VIL28_17750 [Steroidobacteraceae bacterium]